MVRQLDWSEALHPVTFWLPVTCRHSAVILLGCRKRVIILEDKLRLLSLTYMNLKFMSTLQKCHAVLISLYKDVMINLRD